LNKWLIIHHLSAFEAHPDLIGSYINKKRRKQVSSNFSRIKRGDLVVYYIPKISVITGIYEVTSDRQYLPSDIHWGEVFTHKIEPYTKPAAGHWLSFRILLRDPKVRFDAFPDKSAWGSHIQGRTCLPLTNHDFAIIKKALSKSVFLKSI
jgi:hypothetical protein